MVDADGAVVRKAVATDSPVESRQSLETGRQEFVTTPDGLAISVWEWGNPGGPEILFIHGLAQCHLSFAPQVDSHLARRFRLVAFDLRGHGDSAKPLDPAFYQDGRRWADEVAAVIGAKRLEHPVLVGWSLGGRVLREYLVHHGDRHLAGINIVSSRPIEDPSILAPASRANLAGQPADLAGRIRASAAFLRACFHRQPSEAEFGFALAYNMLLPRAVRDAVAGWTPDRAAIRAALGKVSVPALVTHGLADELILPAAAEMTLAAIPHSRGSFYPDCGHSPFCEDAERFNRELAEFAAAAVAGSANLETAPHGRRR
jgi:non-heme chloroperoxidase